MKKILPLSIVLVVLLVLGGIQLSTVSAQDTGDTQVSDYALDVSQGEKDTANDVDAQNNQQGVNQNEEVQAAADDGDTSTEPVVVALDQMIAPEEAQESAKLIDNPQATSSENDSGQTLQDQSTQNPDDIKNQNVNNQDDNKAPTVDPDTSPQSNQPQEQPLNNIQNLDNSNQSSDMSSKSNDQTQPSNNEGVAPE